MTTDRELLELAAKAAGMDGFWDEPWGEFVVKTRKSSEGQFWRPLTDDSDALRLAVKARINLHICESDAMTTAYAEGGIQGAAVDFMDDPYAATRRVIVRAAAAIGGGK